MRDAFSKNLVKLPKFPKLTKKKKILLIKYKIHTIDSD